MCQMYQYFDQLEYVQYLSFENFFVEVCMLVYILVGEVDVLLKVVFESCVQDFFLDVLLFYILGVVGIIKFLFELFYVWVLLNMFKFNVVMYEFFGFVECEGIEVYVQFFILGVLEEDGIMIMQMIKDFDEGFI